MAMNRKRLYLVSYDIADPRRLGRVHRFLKDKGVPLQYSVFTLCVSPVVLASLLESLAERIDPRLDDIRAYAISGSDRMECLGVQIAPEGVFLLLEGQDFLLMG